MQKKYKFPYHCDKVLALMSEGKANCELFTELDVTKSLFFKWVYAYPEFEEAVEKGREARKAFYFKEARDCWRKGKDKGYKYFQAIAKDELNLIPTQNTQVNIGSINVNEQKSEQELIESIQTKLQRMPIDINYELVPKDIKAIEYTEVKETDDGSE